MTLRVDYLARIPWSALHVLHVVPPFWFEGGWCADAVMAQLFGAVLVGGAFDEHTARTSPPETRYFPPHRAVPM